MFKKFYAVPLSVIAFILLFAALPAAAAVKEGERPQRLELILILDESGSMSGLESDTIGGFNAMIEKQKRLEVPVNVTTVLFNDKRDVLYSRRNIHHVHPMTNEEYLPGGTTALLDAVGSTILAVDRTEAAQQEGTKVIFVIITDGEENSSVEFSAEKVKAMISARQEKEGWEFIYLGANIDAVKEADSIGVSTDNAITYRNTPSGVRANYDAVSAYMAESAAGLDAKERGAWKEQVEQDSDR